MAHVFTLGMAVLDHVFQVEAFPSAGEKYRADAYTTQLGGPATMAAIAIERLGGRSSLCTRLGDDANSGVIISELDAAGINWSPSVIVPEAFAPVSSVNVNAAGERQVVNYRGRGLAVSAAAINEKHLATADAVLVDPRWPEGAARVVKMASERGIPAVVDAESDLEALDEAMAAASHIVFSVQGLRALSRTDDMVEGLKYCAGRYNAWLGITRGEKGVIYLENGTISHVAAFPVKAIDTLGAGDVWHGAFALALGEKKSVLQAARFANAAAAIKCMQGTGFKALPTRQDTLALLAGAGSVH